MPEPDAAQQLRCSSHLMKPPLAPRFPDNRCVPQYRAGAALVTSVEGSHVSSPTTRSSKCSCRPSGQRVRTLLLVPQLKTRTNTSTSVYVRVCLCACLHVCVCVCVCVDPDLLPSSRQKRRLRVWSFLICCVCCVYARISSKLSFQVFVC